MSWSDMSLKAWDGARVLQQIKSHRASTNRFYYAAFSAVTAECRKRTHRFDFGYEHPSHRGIGREIKSRLVNLSKQDRNDLRDAVRRLYDARIEADYHANAPFNDPIVRAAMRDARFVLESLNVLE